MRQPRPRDFKQQFCCFFFKETRDLYRAGSVLTTLKSCANFSMPLFHFPYVINEENAYTCQCFQPQITRNAPALVE